jgi:hypothetical protein
LAEEFIKACKEVFPNATLTHIGGGDEKDELYIEPRRKKRGRAPHFGASYPDSTVELKAGDTSVYVHFDTFATLASGMPNKGEERRFARLYRNVAAENTAHVRMPKLEIDEAIDKRALRDFAQELCEELKERMKGGRDPDLRKKNKIVEFFREKKTKKPPGKSPP